MEYFFTCPYCWQRISIVLDLAVDRQSYVEDCEVCCNPIRISYGVVNGMVEEFEAESLEQ